jgi:hypothetical protein
MQQLNASKGTLLRTIQKAPEGRLRGLAMGLNSDEIIVYQTEDGRAAIDVHMEGETMWLSKAQMAHLFYRDRSVISKHIKSIFSEGELDEKSNVQSMHIANSDKPVLFYDLDVIIAVGYRVRSTASEIIFNRANAELPFMGLTSFEGKRPKKSEVTIAKNYMNEKELFM